MNEIPTSRKVFLSGLTREEQLGTLFDWCQSLSSEHASNVREHDDVKKEITYLKGELSGIGRRREKTMSTSEKFRVEFGKQNAAWIWYRDHVLASTLAMIQTTVVLAILYLVFGGKLP